MFGPQTSLYRWAVVAGPRLTGLGRELGQPVEPLFLFLCFLLYFFSLGLSLDYRYCTYEISESKFFYFIFYLKILLNMHYLLIKIYFKDLNVRKMKEEIIYTV